VWVSRFVSALPPVVPPKDSNARLPASANGKDRESAQQSYDEAHAAIDAHRPLHPNLLGSTQRKSAERGQSFNEITIANANHTADTHSAPPIG